VSEDIRIGVYICHCGTNIAGVVNVKELVEYAKTLPHVLIAKDYTFMCSAPGQEMIKNDIRECKLNRVVVAACSPSMHEATFRAAVEEAGLNPYLLEMANIREHCSWVHPDDPEAATEKAKDIIRRAVAKAIHLEPLERIKGRVVRKALVLGGGVAGMRAAIDLAERGFKVYIVERSPTLGGHASRIGYLDGSRGPELVKHLVNKVIEAKKYLGYGRARLVIDSMSAFWLDKPAMARRYSYYVKRVLYRWDFTALLISQYAVTTSLGFGFGIEHVADGIIRFRKSIVRGELKRYVIIEKMRQTEHSLRMHEIEILNGRRMRVKAPTIYRKEDTVLPTSVAARMLAAELKKLLEIPENVEEEEQA